MYNEYLQKKWKGIYSSISFTWKRFGAHYKNTDAWVSWGSAYWNKGALNGNQIIEGDIGPSFNFCFLKHFWQCHQMIRERFQNTLKRFCGRGSCRIFLINSEA